MRITAGALRGRKLTVGRGRAIRPTSSKVREAIFNLLSDRIHGSRVLDLFAGAGALGIEALSRGAASALFVDSSREAEGIIGDNLERLGLGGSGRVERCEVLSALDSLLRGAAKFDIVFVDPPYGRGLAEESLEKIGKGSMLSPSGVVVAEHGKREAMGEEYGDLRLEARKQYGDTQISVFSKTRKGGRG